MSHTERSSDVQEVFGVRALAAGIGGLILLAIGIVAFMYMGPGGIGLAIVLTLAGVGLIIYAIVNMAKIRQVPSFPITCPYCNEKNSFNEKPLSDVRCTKCLRMVPITDGRILNVTQVRCGFCNALNWYSERSVGLICEDCNREIPISTADGSVGHTALGAYAAHDESGTFDLVLTSGDPHNENLVSALQHMLALNRNQVKDILEALPATLLVGVPKRKADMLAAQLRVHEGGTDVQPHQG
ncbi:MAG: hypothetical protein KF812_11580 [Fimbriimonadaceae bacterium]|nr:hypothetical protein [Fimbriimonadaceae bacterium]